MGVDYLIQLPCAPRKAFAGEDVREGSLRIMSMMKAESRAALLADQAKKAGKDPATMSIKMVQMLPTGPVESELHYNDMIAETAPLKQHAAACANCPANLTDDPYGCYGSIRYPIAESSEAWLMERVQGPGTIGGEFLFRAIADFGYDGSRIRSYRERNLLAAKTAPVRSWKTGWLSKKSVTADQIWHALFTVGDLQPAHAQMMLLCLGLLRIEGRIPGAPADDLRLLEKLDRAELDVGPRSKDDGIVALQQFFTALYLAWRTESTLLVDA